MMRYLQMVKTQTNLTYFQKTEEMANYPPTFFQLFPNQTRMVDCRGEDDVLLLCP